MYYQKRDGEISSFDFAEGQVWVVGAKANVLMWVAEKSKKSCGGENKNIILSIVL